MTFFCIKNFLEGEQQKTFTPQGLNLTGKTTLNATTQQSLFMFPYRSKSLNEKCHFEAALHRKSIMYLYNVGHLNRWI